MKEDHTIKWEDAEMMNHSQWYQQRCTLAAWHIQSEKCRMTEMKALFQLCITLLSTYHTHIHPTDKEGNVIALQLASNQLAASSAVICS